MTHTKFTTQDSPRSENFRYTVMASKRVVQRRLYYFLRLCDFIIFHSLHRMVVESVKDLRMIMDKSQNAVVKTT